MKRHFCLKLLALGLALALCPVSGGVVEELGEMDLYDPEIYSGEEPVATLPTDGEEQTPPPYETWTEGMELGEPTPPPDVLEKTPGEGEGTWTGPDDAMLKSEPWPVSSELELRMGLGEKYALGGSVTNYQSDNPAVASVDARTGIVTAVALGTARISAVRRDGGTVSCVVKVLGAPDTLTFGTDALTLGAGEAFLLAARLPEGTASAGITYASSDGSIVTVDASGNLRARRTGSALVGAMAYNGVKAVCRVKVLKAPSKLTLSTTRLVLGTGETFALKAKLPSKTSSRITWKCSDESVVTVSDSGEVRAVAAGTAVVRAITFNGRKADCKVWVLDGAPPTSLTLDALSLELGVGERVGLRPAVGAGEAALFSYASSNKRVATVSKDGVITPKKRGEAGITVSTHNGLKATVAVKVLKAPSKVRLSETEITVEAGKSVRLEAKLPSGSASAITWESSDAAVATLLLLLA